MDKENQDKTIPVMFQVLNNYEKSEDIPDTRFIRVKIWLMHLGQNLHGTFFGQEATANAIPSLANTPIVGFIEANGDGVIDFSNHREETRIEDGELKTKYLGQAFGTIPETNNAKFEKRIADDGVERTYLTVEGLIWTKWEDSVGIIERLNTMPQSMELDPDSIIVEEDEYGNWYFKEFKFNGACILGQERTPAMIGSTVEVDFSAEVNNTIKEKLHEFNTYFMSKEEQEVTKEKDFEATDLGTEEVVETIEEEEVVVEDVAEEIVEEDVTEEVVEEVTYSEKEYTALAEQLELFEVELEELRNYKRVREESDLKAKFSEKLTEDVLETIFTEMQDSDLEDIEKEIFATIGKLNFEAPVKAKKEEPYVKVEIPQTKEAVKDNPYGNIFD